MRAPDRERSNRGQTRNKKVNRTSTNVAKDGLAQVLHPLSCHRSLNFKYRTSSNNFGSQFGDGHTTNESEPVLPLAEPVPNSPH